MTKNNHCFFIFTELSSFRFFSQIPVPSQDLVIIRMGEIADEDSLVPITFDNELWEKINALIN